MTVGNVNSLRFTNISTGQPLVNERLSMLTIDPTLIIPAQIWFQWLIGSSYFSTIQNTWVVDCLGEITAVSEIGVALGMGIAGLVFLGAVWWCSGYCGNLFLDGALGEEFWTWKVGQQIVLISRLVLLVLAFALVLTVFGLDLFSIISSPSIIALLLGIILAPFVGMLINGLSLRYSRRFDEKDVIEFQQSGVRGIVDSFSLTHIKIITLDNEYITIPTWRIRNKDIMNYSKNGDARRVSIDVLVTYGSSIDQAQTALQNAANNVDDVVDAMRNHDYVVDDNKRTRLHDDIFVCLDPQCRIEEFADSGILLRLYFWIEEPAAIARIKSEIMGNIVDKEGEMFHFAFPHRRILGTGRDDELELKYTESQDV